MKVYLAMSAYPQHCDYDVLAVFASREAAEEWQERYISQPHPGPLFARDCTIQEHHVFEDGPPLEDLPQPLIFERRRTPDPNWGKSHAQLLNEYRERDGFA